MFFPLSLLLLLPLPPPLLLLLLLLLLLSGDGVKPTTFPSSTFALLKGGRVRKDLAHLPF